MAKILLVDDNPGLLAMQRGLLERGGHVVTTATNGKEAVERAQRESFELLITDLVMPEKEGIETIIELHRKFPAMKIIAISGGGRINAKDYLDLAGKLGASKTFSKPFSGKDLLAAVASLTSVQAAGAGSAEP
jgi:CheY-like chemotaxis protein